MSILVKYILYLLYFQRYIKFIVNTKEEQKGENSNLNFKVKIIKFEF